MKKIILIFTIQLIFIGTLMAQPSTRTWIDVVYGNASSTQKLDIYLPSTGNGPFPVVVWVHGGAFKFGSKANPQSKAELNANGIAVVSIDYRLSGEAIWPAQYYDLKAVIQFIKANASTYYLDKNKIGAWGASAGGHLASMLGIAFAQDSNTRINAVVDWFGPIDFYTMDEDMVVSGVPRCTGANGDSNSPESALIGATVNQNQALSWSASPLSFLDSLPANVNLPKFLIMHGGKDCNIAANQSVRLKNAIQNKFGTDKASYVFFPNGTHGGVDFTYTSTVQSVITFFTTVFNQTTTDINSPVKKNDIQLLKIDDNKFQINVLSIVLKITDVEVYDLCGIKLNHQFTGNVIQLYNSHLHKVCIVKVLTNKGCIVHKIVL